MRISEIIQKIEEYHPYIPDYNGCDGYKSGDPEQECTGVVCALVPTVDVIRKTIELGCNLLYVHEPSYYQTPDYPEWKGGFRNKIYEEKRKFIEDNGIVVYRDHDHTHMHDPDGIFTGVIKYLDWEQYLVDEDEEDLFTYIFDIPEITVLELNQYLFDRIGMNGTRFIGRPDSKISRVAIVAHLYPGAFREDKEENGIYDDYPTRIIRKMEEKGVQAIIPGEIVEWNLLSYISDASMFGHDVACLNIGHYNFEELGAKYAADWIDELCSGEVRVNYVRGNDMWKYQLNKN